MQCAPNINAYEKEISTLTHHNKFSDSAFSIQLLFQRVDLPGARTAGLPPIGGSPIRGARIFLKKRKEKIIFEKKQVKSMLKTDFGLNKKDTTVKAYVPEKEVEDKIEIDFNEEETPPKDSIKKKTHALQT